MTPERLAAALAAQAAGSYGHEAAVRLLIEHGCWLGRQDFVRFVDIAPSFADERVMMGSVDWETVLAADLPASSSETQMLAIAAELAGVATDRSLGALICGLDRANVALVIRAVLHAHYGADGPPLTVTPFDDGPLPEVRARHIATAAPSPVDAVVELGGPGL